MFQTLEDYLAELMPAAWMRKFREICRGRESGALSETGYFDAINDLVCRDTSDESMSRLSQSLQKDFDMQGCRFTHHFIARLLARFHGSVMDFLMERIARLKRLCCKRKRERSRADGITLVMDPGKRTLLTIFAC